MSDLIKLLNEPEGDILISIVAAISVFFMILCVWSVLTIVEKRKKCHKEIEVIISDFYDDRFFKFGPLRKIEEDSHSRCKPIYEYTYNDKKYTYQSKLVTCPDKTEIGDKHTLYINPDKPSQVREKEDFNIWSSIVACVVANIALVLCFVLSML